MGSSIWCGLIGGASVICVIAEFLIPPGKIGKAINIVLSLFIIGSLIDFIQHQNKIRNFPIIKSDKITLQNKNKNFTDKIEQQTDNLINKSLEAVIRDNLRDFKINPKKIEIFTDKNEDNCIVMIRCKIYVKSEQLNLATKAKGILEKDLKICIEIIEV